MIKFMYNSSYDFYSGVKVLVTCDLRIETMNGISYALGKL